MIDTIDSDARIRAQMMTELSAAAQRIGSLVCQLERLRTRAKDVIELSKAGSGRFVGCRLVSEIEMDALRRELERK